MSDKIYGVVEGFFSKPLKPLDYKQRMKTLEYIGQECPGINSYLFCPKDDIYIIKKPYISYPRKRLEEIETYIKLCKINQMRFIYGLNPVFGEKELLSKEIIIKKILNRFKQLKSVGCNDFCLLFDDIPIAYDTFNNMEKIDNTTFQNIIDIVNAVYNGIKEDCEIFLFCGPDYCFKNNNQFTDILLKLDHNIYVFWTGNNIFTKDISTDNLKKTLNIIGNKKLAIWKNYPVNDLQQNVGMYNLGGYPVFDIEKNNNIPIFVNPMREFGASFPFLKTFSDYIKYNFKESLNTAISNLLEINIKIAGIISAFGQFDIYDDNKKIEKILSGIEMKNIVDTINKIEINNEWGTYFFKSIKPLIKQIEYFYKIFYKINTNSECCKIVRKSDIFPTTSTNPRYFIEIYDIIKKRACLGYFTKKGLSDLKKFIKYKNLFAINYSGSKGLKLTNEDKNLYLKLNKNIIELDQREIIYYLNNKNISKKQKKNIFIKRSFINRFYIGNFD